MLREGLATAVGSEVPSRLVHDAPHNLLWQEREGRVVHRKGATPAAGADPPAPAAGTTRCGVSRWSCPAPWVRPASCCEGWAIPERWRAPATAPAVAPPAAPSAAAATPT